MINGAAVTVEPGAASYTYTATASDTGFQITSCTFGTVKDYAKVQIYAEVYKLWGNDKQIAITPDTDHKNAEGFVKSDYYEDSKSISEVAADAISDADDAIDALDDDATVAEKVAAVKTEIEKGVKAVDEEYSKVVSESKVKALAAIKALDKSFDSNEAFDAADRASILATGTKAINDSTTLEGLAKVISAATDANGDFIDTYNKLYDQKRSAFKMVSDALIEITDPAFDDTEDGALALAALKVQMEAYGLSVDTLPSEVADEWNTKISAATSFDVYTADPAKDSTDTYSKGDVIMGYEGAKAVTESYTKLQDGIVEAITNSYYKEINDSKVLNSDAMTTLRGVVNGAIKDWLRDHTTAALGMYFDATAPASGTNVSGATTGLIGAIELRLSNSTSTTYQAFAAERLDTAIAEAYKQVKAEIASVNGDSVYASMFGTKMTKSSTDAGDTKNTYAKGDYVVPGYIGTNDTTNSVDARIKNPFVKDLTSGTKYLDKDGKATGKYIVSAADYATSGMFASYSGSTADKTSVANAIGTTTVAAVDFNMQTLLEKVFDFKEDGSLKTTGAATTKINGLTDVKDIKSAENKLAGIFTNVYSAAVKEYNKKQRANLVTTQFAADGVFYSSTALNYITATTIGTLYDGLSLTDGNLKEGTNLAAISGYAYSLMKSAANLVLLNNDLDVWASANSGDTGLVTSGKIVDTNGVYKAALDITDSTSIISKILDGSLDTEEKIQKAVNGLDDIYATDVVAYGEKSLEALKEYYNGLINLVNITAAEVQKYKKAYDDVLKTWKYDVASDSYKGVLSAVALKQRSLLLANTYDTCDNWLLSAKAYVNAANGGSGTFNHDGSTNLNNEILYLELVDKGVIVLSEANLATEQQKLIGSVSVTTQPTVKFNKGDVIDAFDDLTGLVASAVKGDGETADDALSTANISVKNSAGVLDKDGKVTGAGSVTLVYKSVVEFNVTIALKTAPTALTVSGESTITKGAAIVTKQYTVAATGTDASNSVVWSVKATNPTTGTGVTISATGLLSVATDATDGTFTITATSSVDSTVKGTLVVTIS